MRKNVSKHPPSAVDSTNEASETSSCELDVLVKVALLLGDAMHVMSGEELAGKLRTSGHWPSPPGEESTAALCSLIDRDIAENGSWSLFSHQDEGGYWLSDYGDALNVAAFAEADARGRYIVFRAQGKTPKQIQAMSLAQEQEALTRLCDGILVGFREEPTEPAPTQPDPESLAEKILVLLRHIEMAHIERVRKAWMEPVLLQLAEHGRIGEYTESTSAEQAALHALRKFRERK